MVVRGWFHRRVRGERMRAPQARPWWSEAGCTGATALSGRAPPRGMNRRRPPHWRGLQDGACAQLARVNTCVAHHTYWGQVATLLRMQLFGPLGAGVIDRLCVWGGRLQAHAVARSFRGSGGAARKASHVHQLAPHPFSST